MSMFPFLLLPTIPQSIIFRHMSDQERLDAALISQRMRRMIQSVRKLRANYQLSICFQTHTVGISGVRGYCVKRLLKDEKYSKITMLDGEEVPTDDKKSSVPGCRPDDRVLYFSEDKLDEGFKKMYLYLLRKLEITTVCQLLGMIDTVLPLRWKLEKRGIAVKSVEIVDKEMSTDQAETIFSFRFLKDLTSLHCLATPPEDFIAQQFPEYISMNILLLASCQWFNINHLLTCKWVENVTLEESSLTSIDMKIFMTEWKGGEYGNLASIAIKTTQWNKLNFEDISDELADHERGVVIRNDETNFFITNKQGHEAQIWVSDYQFRCKIVITIE